MNRASIVRRLRYGRPIVVVSGLPRSGTSMAMQMLAAGGVPLLTDGVRAPDDDNPLGYFEFEPVKELDQDGDLSWLPRARGKAVKIISLLLTWLPETYNYQVVFMRRDLDEVMASQNKMLAGRGVPIDHARDKAAVREKYVHHLEQVDRFLSSRRCFQTICLDYRQVVGHPAAEARRLGEFLGRAFDATRAAGAVEGRLYRKRAAAEADPA